MMRTECTQVHDDLADLVAGDSGAIERHADHLSTCDDCRDARHEATRLAQLLPFAGSDYVPPADLAARVLAELDERNDRDETNIIGAPVAPQRANDTLPGMAAAKPSDPGTRPTVTTAAVTPTGSTPAATLAMGSAETPAATMIETTSPTVGSPAVASPVAASPAAVSAASSPVATAQAPATATVTPISAARKRRTLVAVAAISAVAAGGVGIYAFTRGGIAGGSSGSSGPIGKVDSIDRAAAGGTQGLELHENNAWRPLRKDEELPAGAEVRTDERTRAAVTLTDGTRLVLDHRTALVFDASEPRHAKLVAGRIVADVVHVDDRPAAIETASGRVDVVGTKFAVTATDALTVVQVVRGAVNLVANDGKTDEVRAGEEGVIDHGKLTVDPAIGLAHEVEWSELAKPSKDEASAGLGALRAYKPGESRDRDWNLALASHDVKVRVSGPVARTEITETFRNDADATLEGVYQFPLPPDAQIDGLALDVDGGFVEGAFVDKERAQKIWRGVIDKAAPRKQEIAQNEIIWVDGNWTDPALLDWKRGGRFELRVYPIPAKGKRTIKLAYTQIVTPRGAWRQYVYPLPHSSDGSTVADQMTVDVEVRGAEKGQVRAAGYDMQADAQRTDVNALTLKQNGFVPRGDLVVEYKATDGDAELRTWTFAGNSAAGPDEKLAEKKNVGIDPKVVDAQRAVAMDTRPTAVLALKPKLPRWREAKSHDYVIVVDASQSMLGERYTRATELASRLVDQMDRRDRFTAMACDSECRKLGALKTPTVRAGAELASWLAAEPAAGASDIVTAIRTAAAEVPASDRERWVIYIGDGFASTGFRKSADVAAAITNSTKGVHVTTIGVGTDADSAVLGAIARGGGGSYLAWVPGQSVKSAAFAGLESTYGSALRNATLELPAGLADAAPTVLPTLRAGEEVLVAARVTGDVAGEVVVKGTVGGEPFVQRYPLKLASISTAPGNGFVPRLWASLAIDQMALRGRGEDRPKLVALSQGYGVMSRETSLLVLESQAMFDAFGVDRSKPSAAKWTGEEAIDEVVAHGTVPQPKASIAMRSANASAPAPAKKPATMAPPADMSAAGDAMGVDTKADKAKDMPAGPMRTEMEMQRGGMIAMRRTWVKVPSVTAYGTVNSSITKAIGDAERALVKNPNSREAHRALVQSLSYAGELVRANEVAKKWLQRDQLDPTALGYQADLLGRDGKRELALRMLAGTVDLDADRAAAHERMVQAYENTGRLAQACSHRIALATIAVKAETAKEAAGALRCLRSLGRGSDADLVARGLPDDATREAAEKLAKADAPAPKLAGDLVVGAHWDGGADLDITLVTPDGTRVSWMGGKSDVVVTDATSTLREQLAVKSLKKGNYLVEIGRADASKSTGPIHGTLEIAALGAKKSLPFELAGTRAIVGRVSISFEERLESMQGSAAPHIGFSSINNMYVRRVMLARQSWLLNCYQSDLMSNPDAAGRVALDITVEPGGHTITRAAGGGKLASTAACVEQQLATMHVEGSPADHLRVTLNFSR